MKRKRRRSRRSVGVGDLAAVARRAFFSARSRPANPVPFTLHTASHSAHATSSGQPAHPLPLLEVARAIVSGRRHTDVDNIVSRARAHTQNPPTNNATPC